MQTESAEPAPIPKAREWLAACAGLRDGLHRVTIGASRAIAKVARASPSGPLEADARGLKRLRAARALPVPAILARADGVLVLGDLGHGRPQRDDWIRAGEGLARLHRVAAGSFGSDHEGWCGASPQDNTRDDDGFRFFATRRLLPQVRRARDAGLLERPFAARIERIAAHLEGRMPTMPPRLVHGDLWIGNLHPCRDGALALIDAGAVHDGWAEGDLAMLTLFGAPPDAFFAAYETASDTPRDWRERAPLHNLHHLLNHLNLFGRGYLEAVQRTVDRIG